MKKAGIWAAVLFVVMLMTAGCGAKNQKEETSHLNRVMENIFKSTDEKEYQQSEESTEVPAWVEECFQSHMTANGYAVLTSTAVYNMAVLSYQNEKTMQIEDLSIEKKDNYYDLNWKVSVKDDEGKTESLPMEGSAQLDEEGLVNSFNITNLSELQKVIES